MSSLGLVSKPLSSSLEGSFGSVENDVPLCLHHKAGSFSVNTPVLEGALFSQQLLSPPGGQLPPERACLWLLFLKKVRLASHLSPGCWNFCSVVETICQRCPVYSVLCGVCGKGMVSLWWNWVPRAYPTPGDRHPCIHLSLSLDSTNVGA